MTYRSIWDKAGAPAKRAEDRFQNQGENEQASAPEGAGAAQLWPGQQALPNAAEREAELSESLDRPTSANWQGPLKRSWGY